MARSSVDLPEPVLPMRRACTAAVQIELAADDGYSRTESKLRGAAIRHGESFSRFGQTTVNERLAALLNPGPCSTVFFPGGSVEQQGTGLGWFWRPTPW